MNTALLTAITCIASVLFLYCFYLLTAILKKFVAIKKLHYFKDCGFFTGHLWIFKSKINESFSLSENIAIICKDYYESGRDKHLGVLWLLWNPYIVLTNAKSVEAVLSSNKVLMKAPEYRYFKPWIGNGLLVSEPQKWKQRRKLLTPTFHFRILQDFLKIMNKHSMVLVDILQEREGNVDLFEVVPLTTLDTICETAMGVNVNAQRNPKSEFVNAIVCVNESIFTRFVYVPYYFDFIFFRTALGKRFKREVDIIHAFSRRVIDERIKEISNDGFLRRRLDSDVSDDVVFFGSKKQKIAFMDLLIHSHLNSVQEDGTHSFTISDICEEVDTFMFEAIESTAAAICWTLHLLGNHELIQNKAYEEILEVLGVETNIPITLEHLQRLKYVECCIKEALRLYPSIPLLARQTTEDINVCGQIIPNGVTLLIIPIYLQRDSNFFPNPDEYIPERFSSENESGNPYAYIPFSAGPRNCIGQRFAMNEMKTIVTNIIRNFTIHSLLPTRDVLVSIEIITRTKSKLLVKFKRRV